MPSFDLICLANSHKLKHRCVAGLRVDGGGWVRPVGATKHGELEYSHYRLPDFSEPKLLDVIRVPVSGPEALPYQPENWRIGGAGWKLLERPAAAAHASVLARAVSREALLFGSPGNGVPEAEFRRRPARESLVLVKPCALGWRTEFSAWDQRNKGRVSLRTGGLDYCLPLTDPRYLEPLTRLPAGGHSSSELGIPDGRTILLTISLSEPYRGICYKLVAAVIVAPPDWGACL